MCGIDTYQADTGKTVCKSCKYPFGTVGRGSEDCTAVCLCLSNSAFAVVMGAFVSIWVVGILVGENRFGLMMNLVFPTLDVFSDMAYILSTKFYSGAMFAVVLMVFLLPIPLFGHVLYDMNAPPKLTWTSWDDVLWLSWQYFGDKYAVPTIAGRPSKLLQHFPHDNMLFFCLHPVIWTTYLIIQLFGLIILVGSRLIFLAFFFVLGSFLHMTKLMAVGKVWNAFFKVNM